MPSSSGGSDANNYGSTPNLEAGSAWAPLKSGNSAWLTAGLIIADVVGAGILGLSVAVAKVGWLAGVVLTLLLLAMNVHISMLMWRVHMHFPSVRSYVQMVEMAFSQAPEGQRTGMALIAGAGQHSFLFAMLAIYMLSCGRALGNIFYSVFVCLPTWTLVAGMLILPFHATARKLGTWQSLIWINVLTIVGTCCIPLAYMMREGPDVTRPPGSVFVAVENINFSMAFGALSTFTFAFTSQFMVIEIISEMKNPSEFPTAYIYMAAPFQAIAFLIVGVGGYYYVGDKVTGMIGDNIPFGMTFQFAAVCLLSHMTVTYLIKGIVLCRAVHSVTDKDADNDDSRASWTAWGLIVLLVAVVVWVIASIVPFFNELVDLVGASLTPVCCYIIPILSYLRWSKDFGSKEQRNFEGFILIVELSLAVLLLVFGTYFSILNIVEKWGSFGPPFACHCQQMWNTCECSATHAGMLGRCLASGKDLALQVQFMVDQNFAWTSALTERVVGKTLLGLAL